VITVDPTREYAIEAIKPGARHAGRRWCHLEDTEGDTERLHAFAARIGCPRRWFQIGVRGTFPHYDLTPRYRLRAIQAGAIVLTPEDSRRLTHEKYQTGRHFAKGDARYGKKLDKNGRIIGVHSRPRRGVVGRQARTGADGGTSTGTQETLPGFLSSVDAR
jgi:hypothetical protein